MIYQFSFYFRGNYETQNTLCNELEKILENTFAFEESLANLPNDSLENMLSSLQVSIYYSKLIRLCIL